MLMQYFGKHGNIYEVNVEPDGFACSAAQTKLFQEFLHSTIKFELPQTNCNELDF